MSRSRHTVAQIFAALKQIEAVCAVEDVAASKGSTSTSSTVGRRSIAALK